MSRNAFLIFFALVLWIEPARGGDELFYSFVPENPTGNDVVRFRLDFTGCFDSVVTSDVDEVKRIVTVRLHLEDVACDDSIPENLVSPRFWEIGLLPPGSYVAEVLVCGGLVMPGTPPCSVVERFDLLAAGPGVTPVPAVVPATRVSGNAFLAAALLLAACCMLRRR